MTWLAVFLAVAIGDALWGRYIRSTAEGRAEVAANYASAIICMTAVTTLAVVDSPWNVIPAACGAWLGTWWSVR